MTRLIRYGVLILLLFCLGCASRSHQLSFDPSEPLRVAVLPFYQKDEAGKIVNSAPELFFVNNIAGVKINEEDPPTQLVQELVQNELEQTGFDVVPPRFVQAQLVHHQFTKDRSYDYEKILNTDRAALGKLLSADALLYGQILEYDRTYYGVETVTSVGVELTLVRASDGKQLFRGKAEDSENRGLTKGPTGYSSVVLEPLLGRLDTELIDDVARRVVKDSLAPLYVKNRPEFLDSTAPAIYASAHDADTGTVSPTRPLLVLMFGTAGKAGTFSIGEVIKNVPMAERSPGHYLGIYYPLSAERFSEQDVYVSLTDEFGRTTRQKIGYTAVAVK